MAGSGSRAAAGTQLTIVNRTLHSIKEVDHATTVPYLPHYYSTNHYPSTILPLPSHHQYRCNADLIAATRHHLLYPLDLVFSSIIRISIKFLGIPRSKQGGRTMFGFSGGTKTSTSTKTTTATGHKIYYGQQEIKQ